MIPYEALIKDLINCLANTSSLIADEQACPIPLDITDTGFTPEDNCRQLLVALSGGPDSTALLLALHNVAPAYNFEVRACHINHGLRGEAADADAAFCQDICRQFDINCQVIKLPLSMVTANGNRFSEDYLRQKRYQHLQDFAKKEKIAFILTAHTLDDQAETIFFRLLRGTALTGLAGIKACRLLDKNIYLLRPLLTVRKQQCQEYLFKQSIKACNDASNLDLAYNRNYIRHQIIPAVHSRFPDFVQHLDSMRQVIIEEDKLMTDLAEQLLHKLESANLNKWPLELIRNEPLALQRRAVACALNKRGVEVTFNRVQNILALAPEDKALNLNQHWYVRNIDNQLIWKQIVQSQRNNNIDNFNVKLKKFLQTHK